MRRFPVITSQRRCRVLCYPDTIKCRVWGKQWDVWCVRAGEWCLGIPPGGHPAGSELSSHPPKPQLWRGSCSSPRGVPGAVEAISPASSWVWRPHTHCSRAEPARARSVFAITELLCERGRAIAAGAGRARHCVLSAANNVPAGRAGAGLGRPRCCASAAFTAGQDGLRAAQRGAAWRVSVQTVLAWAPESVFGRKEKGLSWFCRELPSHGCCRRVGFSGCSLREGWGAVPAPRTGRWWGSRAKAAVMARDSERQGTARPFPFSVISLSSCSRAQLGRELLW